MWIISFAEGGMIGSWPTEAEAKAYRSLHLQGRIANVHQVEIVAVHATIQISP